MRVGVADDVSPGDEAVGRLVGGEFVDDVVEDPALRRCELRMGRAEVPTAVLSNAKARSSQGAKESEFLVSHLRLGGLA